MQKHTPWVTVPADKQGGHIGYLLGDKGVVISCDPNSALFNFKYDLQTSTTSPSIGYKYQCKTFPGMSGTNITTRKTTNSPVQQGQAYVLRNLAVNCDNTPIIGFNLKLAPDGQNIYYEYQCGNKQLKNPESRQTADSISDKLNGASTFHLANQELDCPGPNRFLTSFELKATDDLNFYHYDYVCAENTDVPPIPPNPDPTCPICPVCPKPLDPIPGVAPNPDSKCPICPVCPKPSDPIPAIPWYRSSTLIGGVVGLVLLIIAIIIIIVSARKKTTTP